MDDKVRERLDNKVEDRKYLPLLLTILLIGISSVATVVGILWKIARDDIKSKDKEISALHAFYRDREDKVRQEYQQQVNVNNTDSYKKIKSLSEEIETLQNQANKSHKSAVNSNNTQKRIRAELNEAGKIIKNQN